MEGIEEVAFCVPVAAASKKKPLNIPKNSSR